MTEPSFYPAPPPRARLVVPATVRPLPPMAPALEGEAAHVVAPDRQIDDALHDMIVFGVRLLLVVRDQAVAGVITAYDIMGERPIQFLHDPFRSGMPHRHADILVADIMTPIEHIRLLRFRSVAGATVADIAALFRRTSDTHLLVAEDEPGGVVIRGIFSRSRLERQLEGH
jgi:CBS domain-containing protein